MVVAYDPLAQDSRYEKGVEILAGPRVGPDIVDLVGCQGRVQRMTVAGLGVVDHGTTSPTPPALRRMVLARDGGCAIAECGSVYRLEVHHILPRARGGPNTAGNLVTLCWWHHHVAVHRRGMRIDPQSPPGRRRLLPARHRNYNHQPPEPDPHTITILQALHTTTNRSPPQ